ncbi:MULTISPECIES: hypothetical protein [unclassified Moraxella]|uniref:hypothetical protein n=1 Tax=unclassified Moraxella TaxID=2685852 RepID=UPI003AF66EDB
MSELNTIQTTVTDDFNKLERLYSRWLVGDGGLLNINDVPSDFAPVLTNVAEPKKSLVALAIASQYQAMMLQHPLSTNENNSALAIDPNSMQPLPILPSLDLPFIPSKFSYLNREIVARFKKQRGQMYVLRKEQLFLQFLAYRGFVLLPQHGLEIINQFRDTTSIHVVYSPWIQWLGKEVSSSTNNATQAVKSVKSAKKNKLSNSSQDNEADDSLTLAQELKDYFHLKTKREDKSQSLIPKKLASDKLMALRGERLKQVDLNDFAEVFGLSLAQLIEVWHFENFENLHTSIDLNTILIENMAVNLPDVYLPAITNKLCDYIISMENGARLYYLSYLWSRFDEQTIQAIIARLFYEADIAYEKLASLLNGKPLLVTDKEKIQQSARWQAIIQYIKESTDDDARYQWRTDDLEYLGMMLPQPLAEWAYQTLVDKGIPKFDPVLSVLDLNRQLK